MYVSMIIFTLVLMEPWTTFTSKHEHGHCEGEMEECGAVLTYDRCMDKNTDPIEDNVAVNQKSPRGPLEDRRPNVN